MHKDEILKRMNGKMKSSRSSSSNSRSSSNNKSKISKAAFLARMAAGRARKSQGMMVQNPPNAIGTPMAGGM